MTEQLTLYTAKICPYAQRVELALAEAGARDVSAYQIDLQNKPEWYAPKINPASKVPAISYGGPQVSPDQPSPESTKIAESLVILEFLADIYPNSNLLPKDPVSRAKVRFFIDAVSTKLTPNWTSFAIRGESPEGLFKGVEDIQNLIPNDAKFAVGNEYTIADAAIVPFIARMELSLRNDMGAYKEHEGTKALEVLKGPKYSKFWKYFEATTERSSFKSTFDHEYVKAALSKRFTTLRSQRQAA